MLDRAGQPLQVPVTVSERVDADSGQRWLVADITLAALGAGDYCDRTDGDDGGRREESRDGDPRDALAGSDPLERVIRSPSKRA